MSEYELRQAYSGSWRDDNYFQHIYHSVGIEGRSMTLEETMMIVKTGMAVGGKSIREHNEVLGMDVAMKYIYGIPRTRAITLDTILEIHRRVLGSTNFFEAGRLRSVQVYVGKHIPPAATQVPLLMNDFVTWLNTTDRLSLHLIRFAALAHYKFVCIHPFIDGNGRTSRLLMSLILMRRGFRTIIIRQQDRFKYFGYIRQANEGDVEPFIRFIAQCAEQTWEKRT